MSDNENVGEKIRNLRLRSNISLRQLATNADVAVSYLSSIEKGKVSPTLALLRRILLALGTNLNAFFSETPNNDSKYIFRKGDMQSVNGRNRNYTFVLPKRDHIKFEIIDEIFHSQGNLPEFEVIAGELAGYVIQGSVVIEIGDDPSVVLNTGDAFYVPAGIKVRGYLTDKKTHEVTRLITFIGKPEY